MLPRACWEEMGGFDEAFLPAYCEDSDLAFRLRAAGWKVLYQPEAMVIHHEGVSHGTDTTTGIKAHQVENSRKLFLRWRDTLARDALPNGQLLLRARDRALRRRVTLVIDHYVPQPDRDAGSRTMMAFMQALLDSGRVVKFFPHNEHHSPGYTEALQRLGIEVLSGRRGARPALRGGAGVRLKVVEGMHRGLPVVTTPIGAQGLPRLGAVLDVAETAEGLAEAVLRLLGDDALWRARVAAQTAYVAARFSPAAMRHALEDGFAEVAR
jgi:hypothetical protein